MNLKYSFVWFSTSIPFPRIFVWIFFFFTARKSVLPLQRICKSPKSNLLRCFDKKTVFDDRNSRVMPTDDSFFSANDYYSLTSYLSILMHFIHWIGKTMEKGYLEESTVKRWARLPCSENILLKFCENVHLNFLIFCLKWPKKSIKLMKILELFFALALLKGWRYFSLNIST